MTVFADSSALVKLYADEDGHEEIRGLDPLAIAQIARVEVPAALWGKHRADQLTAHQAQLLTADFEADYFGTADGPPRFAAVAATSAILDNAARLCAVHGLRACDGVQLATAVTTRAVDPDCETFAAFDTALRWAAAAEGFALLPSP